jgi:hypothetical protein
MSIIYCLNCNKETKNLKFCSNSCSASYNNKGKRRHGKDPGTCIVCNKPKKSYKRKFCSNICSSKSRILSKTHHQKLNRHRQSLYRTKKYRHIHPTANKNLIKQFYLNCPEGYEVDHIIPVSKGGPSSPR